MQHNGVNNAACTWGHLLETNAHKDCLLGTGKGTTEEDSSKRAAQSAQVTAAVLALLQYRPLGASNGAALTCLAGLCRHATAVNTKTPVQSS